MKYPMKLSLFIFYILFSNSIILAQNVGIGTTNPKAALDVHSNSNGFLPPRLTISERDGIPSPEIGLIIYCTECDELQLFNGVFWKNMAGTPACVYPIPPTVNIGYQVWTQKNLAVKNYRNGDPIPEVSDPTAWASLTTGAWCYVNNDPSTEAKYGILYNWYAVNDSRGLAPLGMHIPSNNEANYIATIDNIGGKMKEIGTTNWLNPNADATNTTGFTGLPAGFRHENGNFFQLGMTANFYTSTYNPPNANIFSLGHLFGNINQQTINPNRGLSVRCIKD